MDLELETFQFYDLGKVRLPTSLGLVIPYMYKNKDKSALLFSVYSSV